MSFYAELKRRNVIRVGAAYAVVSWLILQVIDIAFPRLGLPDWTVTLVLVLLLTIQNTAGEHVKTSQGCYRY